MAVIELEIVRGKRGLIVKNLDSTDVYGFMVLDGKKLIVNVHTPELRMDNFKETFKSWVTTSYNKKFKMYILETIEDFQEILCLGMRSKRLQASLEKNQRLAEVATYGGMEVIADE